MKDTFGIRRFAYLHHALIFLHKMEPKIVADLLYELNAAHLQSRRAAENIAMTESSKHRFVFEMRARSRQHHNLMSLYFELERLQSTISIKHISEDQQDALKGLGMVMFGIQRRFREQHCCDIKAALLANKLLGEPLPAG